MGCKSLFFTLSNVVGAATGSYTLTDSKGVYIFRDVHSSQLSGVTYSIADTESVFTLTSYSQVGTYSICNPGSATTVLLIHADGTLVDYSRFGHQSGLNGTSYLSTTQSKFGTGAMSFPSASDWVGTTNSSDFDFSQSSFTMECFFKYSSPTGSNVLFSSGAYFTSGNWWHISVAPGQNAFFDRNNGVMVFSQYIQDDGAVGRQAFYEAISGSWSSVHAPDTWYHAAVVREYADRITSTMSFYIDGVSQFSVLVTSATYSVLGTPYFPKWPYSTGFDKLAIGPRFGSGYGYSFAPGLIIDEARISNVPRWTSNFTPPSVPYIPN